MRMPRIMRPLVLAVLPVSALLFGGGVALADAPHPSWWRWARPAAERVVTVDDNNSTIHLRSGGRARLQLGAEYDWVATVENPAVLRQVHPFAPPPPGTQKWYIAADPGETNLAAEGGVHCEPGAVCISRLATFQVHIVVEGGAAAAP